MEAIRLINNFLCIIIREICDYADSYKNKIRQEYIIIIIATLTKELLGYMVGNKI